MERKTSVSNKSKPVIISTVPVESNVARKKSK